MINLETLTVPVDLGAWLGNRPLGNSGGYFNTINALYHYWESVISSPTGSFITDNKKELIEVILGSRGYEVEEEPLYYALIKGHELASNPIKYWAKHKDDSEDLFITYRRKDDNSTIVENTKNRWNGLGINDSNADFVRVEEDR